MSKVYLKELKYNLGSYLDLSELEKQEFVFSTADDLRSFGYHGAYIMHEKFDKGNGTIIAKFLDEYDSIEIDKIIYNSTFIEYRDSLKGERDFMEVFMDYPLIRYLNKKKRSLGYWGITQQACNGLFKCIELAKKEFDLSRNIGNILCISEDILPNECYYDRPKQRMLFSDSLSGLILTKEKTSYQMVDIQSTHVANDNYFTFLTELLKLVRRICFLNEVEIDEIEKYFVPNFWNETWKAVFKQLYHDNKAHFVNTIEKNAHCLSADFICNLVEYEKNRTFISDKHYISISYGYGGNISVMLFRYAVNE